MRATLIRPTRNGKRAKQYVARIYRRPGERPVQIPLHVTMKETAQKRVREIMAEMQQEEAGLIPPKALREASARGLLQHLEDYVSHMSQLALDHNYMVGEENKLRRMFAGCVWKTPSDITRGGLEQWLGSLTKQGANTRNKYLSTARTFTGWLVKRQRLAFSPLAGVEKARVKGNEFKNRRAYTREEAARLLAVSGPRSIVYHTALLTGLRRGELEKLEWRDLRLAGDSPSFQVRADTTKNGKDATLSLNPELALKLAEFKPADAKPTDRVFKGLLNRRIEPLKRDLKAAGIPECDASGRTADFHSFRHTFVTWLALAGVPIREAMALARHSESRLTEKVYMDAGQLPLANSVKLLPSLVKNDSPYYAPKSVQSCQSVSLAVEPDKASDEAGSLENKGIGAVCPSGSLPVQESENVRDTGFEPVAPTMSR